LALHPDAHFSDGGCNDLHESMANCLSTAQCRVSQIEQQRVMLLISSSARCSAADGMDWLQSRPLDLLYIVSDVACALHRCCGGYRSNQVTVMLHECTRAISALFKSVAHQHYDHIQLQVCCSHRSHSPFCFCTFRI
jgi:hypothetical protein